LYCCTRNLLDVPSLRYTHVPSLRYKSHRYLLPDAVQGVVL